MGRIVKYASIILYGLARVNSPTRRGLFRAYRILNVCGVMVVYNENMKLSEMQKAAYQNKLDKGFNVSNVDMEFCFLYGEVGEAFDSYRKNKGDVGEELADVAIYLLGLAEILGVDLEEQVVAKMRKNKDRKYKLVGGTNRYVKE